MADVRLMKHSEARDRLIELFPLCFETSMSAEIWDWKYLQNPCAPPDPEVIVALEGGKIVGARPFRFAEMWLGSEKVRAAQRCDTMVHPEHRNRGVFNRRACSSLLRAVGWWGIIQLGHHCRGLRSDPGLGWPGILLRGSQPGAPAGQGGHVALLPEQALRLVQE